MISDEELLRKLLNISPDLRQKALIELEEHWKIEYREYLWKAIEQEKNKDLQLKMVKLAINKIQTKSLRKMLRFVENGTLYPGAINEVTHGYARYENEEVRKATIKAINRGNPIIIQFFSKFLKGRAIELMDETRVKSLINDLLVIDNETNRFILAKALTDRRYTSSKQYNHVAFLEKFFDDPIIVNAILISKLELIEKGKENQFIWKKVKWNKLDKVNLELIDKLLLNSIHSRNEKLRYTAIKILGYQSIENIGELLDPYEETINSIWSEIINKKIELDFIKLDISVQQSIEKFFSNNDIYQLEEVKTFEIHYYTLYKLVLANLPRSILVSLAVDDPIIENRHLCYQSLKNNKFWIDLNGKIIGPNTIWLKVISQALNNLRFETDVHIRETVYYFLESIMLILFDQSSQGKNLDLLEEIRNSRIPQLIEMMKSDNLSAPLYHLIYPFLTNQETIIDETIKLNPKVAKKLINQFLKDIASENSLESMKTLIRIGSYKEKIILLEEIKLMIKSNKSNQTTSEDKVIINCIELLTQLSKDGDVRIKTHSQLLLRKF